MTQRIARHAIINSRALSGCTFIVLRRDGAGAAADECKCSGS
jgi:hypothetical protein